ncbi:hypothetical protein IRY61_04495 [Candidatus Saccharibacteria bacterium]|nr:hypothetical protein [Candidatus Saccharibacteria bacterium]
MMNALYFELRKPAARGTDSMIADAMRHLNTRQHLGKALVVCEQPTVTLSVARKQWLKLARSLQKRRSSTLNPDKILKYTHAITRMQRMYFTIKTPEERPKGEVFFLSPDNLQTPPDNCWSVYLVCSLDPQTTNNVIEHLPEGALIIDYGMSPAWVSLGLRPKQALEARVGDEWERCHKYLQKLGINLRRLIVDGITNPEAMDDALDTVLGGHSHDFLQLANDFQRAMELARPLRLKKQVRDAYDSLILLAHRVQALRPVAYSQHFLEMYDEDDTFFLYDAATARRSLIGSETLEEAYARHTAAGRHHLAKHLRSLSKSDDQLQNRAV